MFESAERIRNSISLQRKNGLSISDGQVSKDLQMCVLLSIQSSEVEIMVLLKSIAKLINFSRAKILLYAKFIQNYQHFLELAILQDWAFYRLLEVLCLSCGKSYQNKLLMLLS